MVFQRIQLSIPWFQWVLSHKVVPGESRLVESRELLVHGIHIYIVGFRQRRLGIMFTKATGERIEFLGTRPQLHLYKQVQSKPVVEAVPYSASLQMHLVDDDILAKLAQASSLFLTVETSEQEGQH